MTPGRRPGISHASPNTPNPPTTTWCSAAGWSGCGAPRVLDAPRCIPSLTIEPGGDFTPPQRSLVGDWLFGCDICQDVCPWNVSFAQATADPELAPRPELAAPDAREFLELGEETFARRYGDTPFERPGREGMRRNAAAVRAGTTL